jgi:hypothetical protein
MVEWSEDHVAVISSLHSTLWVSRWNLVKLQTRRGPLVESGDSWLERLGSGM